MVVIVGAVTSSNVVLVVLPILTRQWNGVVPTCILPMLLAIAMDL